MQPRSSASQRGFTLIEMLTVVVLVGVLATLASIGVRKYILSSKTSEAVSMMASIKTAEEGFKDETFVYLNVSSDYSNGNFYPTATPGRAAGKVQWGGGSGALASNWRTLGVAPDGPVLFSYSVVSWAAGASVPSDPSGISLAQFKLPNPATQQTYLAVAKSDLDGDPSKSTFVVSHSLSTEVHIENDGD
ncbi:MAG TPA: prepilin-type N-terminal cleavage/methylation domain-containing protein [Polyangiaceae bacterium]|jgi:type IV pilus assembly protein PilA|nr:prepilin-type N-terminal cleavage/methylation domain-containing protein [Polyangiaceae bacterium]